MHAVQVFSPRPKQIVQRGLAVWGWEDAVQQSGAQSRP